MFWNEILNKQIVSLQDHDNYSSLKSITHQNNGQIKL